MRWLVAGARFTEEFVEPVSWDPLTQLVDAGILDPSVRTVEEAIEVLRNRRRPWWRKGREPQRRGD